MSRIHVPVRLLQKNLCGCTNSSEIHMRQQNTQTHTHREKPARCQPFLHGRRRHVGWRAIIAYERLGPADGSSFVRHMHGLEQQTGLFMFETSEKNSQRPQPPPPPHPPARNTPKCLAVLASFPVKNVPTLTQTEYTGLTGN